MIFFVKVISGLFGFFLQTTKEPFFDLGFNNSSCNQDSSARMDSQDFLNGSDDSSVKHWRKIVLEQIYHSLIASEGGLKQCIRDALEFHPQSSCTTAIRVQFFLLHGSV